MDNTLTEGQQKHLDEKAREADAHSRDLTARAHNRIEQAKSDRSKAKQIWAQRQGLQATQSVHEAKHQIAELEQKLIPLRKQLEYAESQLAEAIAGGFVDLQAEARARHQAGVDKAAAAQKAAQDSAKETAARNERQLDEIKRQQAAIPGYVQANTVECEKCGQPVLETAVYHSKGEGTYEFCIRDPKGALRSGRFTKLQLEEMGCQF